MGPVAQTGVVSMDFSNDVILSGTRNLAKKNRSTDHGASFALSALFTGNCQQVTSIPGTSTIYTLYKATDGRVFSGSDHNGSVYVSVDNGDNWRFLSTPYWYRTGNNAVWCLVNSKAYCLVGGTGYGGSKIIKSEPSNKYNSINTRIGIADAFIFF